MKNLPFPKTPFEIVLHRPEIPPNTGSVARLCACTGSRLHLVAPIGFSIDDTSLKRAGLDYWEHVYVATHGSLSDALTSLPDRGVHVFTGKAEKTLWEVRFRPGDILVFGSESVGLPKEVLDACPERNVAIPMREGRRSLNLSSAVSVALYEALRQTNTWKGMARADMLP